MDHKIVIVGIGPGSPDYILPIALKKIKSAKILAGSRRALAALSESGQITLPIDKEIPALMASIEIYLQQDDVVILVSGDPGCYSLLPAVQRFLPQAELEVIPGISSFQMAFSRIASVWQDAMLVSLHGREAQRDVFIFDQCKKIAFLTDPVHCPSWIATELLTGGWPLEAKVYLCEALSYQEEKVVSFTLQEVVKVAGFSHSVMVVTG